jgi:hypothetical protein
MDDFRLYRAQARSFERQASLARRSGAREELLELARLWGRLADSAERSERRHEPVAGNDNATPAVPRRQKSLVNPQKD